MFKTLFLVLVLVLTGACSAMGPGHGPAAVRIDPAFSPEQRAAIYDAVDRWDEAIGGTVAVSSWDDSRAVPVIRDDSLASDENRLGHTHYESTHSGEDEIRIAGAGTLRDGTPVAAFDFGTTIAHELGHLLMGGGTLDAGCDGQGHDASPAALMYAHGTPDGAVHPITAEDVARVRAVVDSAW